MATAKTTPANTRRRPILFVGLACAIGALVVVFGRFREQPPPPSPVVTVYAGSAACGPCHEKQSAAWRDSHHARAERAFVAPSDFTQAMAKAAITARPLRWIGVEPLEQVLFALPDGRTQALDLAHDPAKGEWFGIFGSEQRQPGEWGHWTGRGMNWNASCAYCHNTALHKGYDAASDRYTTTFVEAGVGCESCHGPMGAHARGAPAKKVDAARSVDACGACHARRAELSEAFVPGERFDDHFALEVPGTSDGFYADGQVRDESYELTAFLGSRMAHAGVTCADCHDSHSGKTRVAGNALCLSCHASGQRGAPRIEPTQHSHHAEGSAGNECVNCHMPQTSFMQRHARRDHGFTIPDPRLTLEHQVPNACTRCHADKSAKWALNALAAPGARAQRAHARADLVARGRERNPNALAGLLAQLQSDPIVLWRASAADLLEAYLDAPEAVPALTDATRDPEPLVRSHALRALEGTPNREVLEAALNDPSRSVRIAAGWALRATLNEESAAGRDVLRFLELSADQPTGQAARGDYSLARGQTSAALDALRRAVAWDPGSARLREQLGLALSHAGQASAAAEQLVEACRLEPKQPELHYELALAWHEAGNLSEAIDELERAVAIEPRFARAWYNLALARDRSGDSRGALSALTRAEAAAPADPDVAAARAAITARARAR